MEEMDLLKNRIILLENQLRMEKLNLEEMDKEKSRLNKTIDGLKKTIEMSKPQQQELQQRISYL